MAGARLGKGFIESNDHGPDRTALHAELASAAPLGFKFDFHLRSLNVKRPSRTDSRAGPALVASFLVAADAMADWFHLDANLLEILDPFFEIIGAAPQFHYQHSLFSGKDLGFQDIESQIIVANQIGYNGFIDNFLRESQYKSS